MKTKHTKGNWKPEAEEHKIIKIVQEGSRKVICSMPPRFGGGLEQIKRIEADAKIIAQSPELLETLIDANKELKNLYAYALKIKNQILENDIDCVSHIGVDGMDDISLLGLKIDRAIQKATE